MKYLLMILTAFVMGNSYAQTLKGKVVDTEGAALEDVGIFNKTNAQHNHTDATGNFLLPGTQVNDTIYFSRLGAATKTLVVTQNDLQQTITITLEEATISLDQVVLVSEVDVLSKLVDVDLEVTPVKSSQDILRKVPGLIIGQHAGGGKAEQIFLRGFDVDHGTDVAISVDGIPVNMVSHAHGQGYADLHFVIPETIQNIDFGKGPYYADQGNFNTAGYVNLKTRERLDYDYLSLELGQFNTQRMVGMFNLLEKNNSNAYLASEIYLTDGPFDSPQNFNRINLFGRYRYALPGQQKLVLTASHFQSKWDASGQSPQRAVEQGLIGRFGAIDDTEGGNTSRSNLFVNHSKNFGDAKSLNTTAFLSHYNFELFSNFTFFLDDPENGDQIRQFEDRMIVGANTVYEEKSANFLGMDLDYQTGFGFRYDKVTDNQLSHTLNRQTLLQRLAYGDVDETNGFAYVNAKVKSGKFTFNPALRLDYFRFDYVNKLSTLYDSQSEQKAALSPKFNIVYSPNLNTQFFLKSGIGFHSNDARVVVANGGEDILPAAYGFDLGTVVRPFNKLVLNATLWNLFLEQEFVYVGDAGIVEPSGRTSRYGVEVGVRYQASDWLYFYTDANYTHARSVDDPEGENYIPLAPDFTMVGGIALEGNSTFSGGISYRYIDDRPANEDNSIVAEGYFVTDANLNYKVGNWTFGLIAENLFDVAWNETQFATESRLFNETASVEEIHFTPGTPFYVRGKVSVKF